MTSQDQHRQSGAANALYERDGDSIPALGMGTYQLKGSDCRQAVETALDIGIRHLDTARMYENETYVGEGIRESGIAREDIFLTSKLQMGELDRSGVQRSCENSLRDLKTDYLDLLLIHWPEDSTPLHETLAAMATLREQEKVRHIGVSNFPVSWVEKAMDTIDVPIFCNQVEYHPFLDQSTLLDYCRGHGILLVAYSPLARGTAVNHKTLIEIGRKHAKSAAQVALRWLLQQDGVIAIPKGSTRQHIQENAAVFSFSLTDEEMVAIDALEKTGRMINPDFAPQWD